MVRGKLARIAVMLAVLAVAASTLGAMPSQALPEQEGPSLPYGPDVFAGSVPVQKVTSPGGTMLFACISDCGVHKSKRVLTNHDGTFDGLTVHQPGRSLAGHPVRFFLANEHGHIEADEQVGFQGATERHSLDLRFAGPVPFRPSLTTPSATPVPPAAGDTIVAAVPRWVLIMGVLTFLSGVTLVLRARRREAT